jgi:hypothetical protein
MKSAEAFWYCREPQFDGLRSRLSSVASNRAPLEASASRSAATFFNRTLAMNTEKFEGHQEGWRSLWLAIAGVIAIMLIWNVVMLSLNGISY